MAVLPTGTVTFLFTDIEGSTTLLQRLGDRRYAEVQEEHRRLLRAAFEEGNGREVDRQGDSFLVAFSRAREAVGAAVAAQLALTKHLWPEGASLRVRMGLHTGEPLGGTSDYIGLDVHRAARICAAGHGGQILVSQAVGILVAPDLPPGVSLRDLGTHRLKDLRESEHLFQVMHPDLPTDFPPIKSLGARSNNLPIQLTSFIGREREIAAVKKSLSKARLVTLTGSGGCGKTRLALHVAADLAEHYADGVWFVHLASLSEETLVPKAVAAALDIPEQPGRPLTEPVADYLRRRTLLIVLDNCEHLLRACSHLVDTLLRTSPNLFVLATTREVLGIDGELIYRVPSLSNPDLNRLPPPDALTQYEAVRLFVERAALRQPGFALTSTTAPAVVAICTRLDGIPLAIELAAARLGSVPLDVIAARLDDRFRLLVGGNRTGLPRHQTLRAAMAWSYDLLSEPEQTVLRRLAVFAGGFSVEAAEAVCAGDGIDPGDVLELLTRLVEKSLVLFEEREGGARYGLLETVRQYGQEKLAETGDTTALRRRHRDFFLALAERGELGLRSSAQDAWLARFETEHDNFRAALEWSSTDEGGAEPGLRLAGGMTDFWHMRGYWSEGREWLERALARSDEAPVACLPKAISGIALIMRRLGEYELAIPLCEKGLAICQDLDEKWCRGRLLHHFRLYACNQGDYERARVLCEEALVLFRETGDDWCIGVGLIQLAETVRLQGNYAEADAYFARALAIFRECGNKYHCSYILHYRGDTALRQGDLERAVAFFAEGLTLASAVSTKTEIIECLDALGQVACERGDHRRAARIFGAAEALGAISKYRREHPEQAFHDRHQATTQAVLGDAAFAAAWAEGQAMTLEQAIEYALADPTG
jgi:predicted ATPase/class 3 adenylate cyclase